MILEHYADVKTVVASGRYTSYNPQGDKHVFFLKLYVPLDSEIKSRDKRNSWQGAGLQSL